MNLYMAEFKKLAASKALHCLLSQSQVWRIWNPYEIIK